MTKSKTLNAAKATSSIFEIGKLPTTEHTTIFGEKPYVNKSNVIVNVSSTIGSGDVKTNSMIVTDDSRDTWPPITLFEIITPDKESTVTKTASLFYVVPINTGSIDWMMINDTQDGTTMDFNFTDQPIATEIFHEISRKMKQYRSTNHRRESATIAVTNAPPGTKSEVTSSFVPSRQPMVTQMYTMAMESRSTKLMMPRNTLDGQRAKKSTVTKSFNRSTNHIKENESTTFWKRGNYNKFAPSNKSTSGTVTHGQIIESTAIIMYLDGKEAATTQQKKVIEVPAGSGQAPSSFLTFRDSTLRNPISFLNTKLLHCKSEKSTTPSYTLDMTRKLNASGTFNKTSKETEHYLFNNITTKEIETKTLPSKTNIKAVIPHANHSEVIGSNNPTIAMEKKTKRTAITYSFTPITDMKIQETVPSRTKGAIQIRANYNQNELMSRNKTWAESTIATKPFHETINVNNKQYVSIIRRSEEATNKSLSANTSKKSSNEREKTNKLETVTEGSAISDQAAASPFFAYGHSLVAETTTSLGTITMESDSRKSITPNYTSDRITIGDTIIKQSNSTDATHEPSEYTEQYKSTVLLTEEYQSNRISSNTNVGNPITQAHSSELMTLTAVSKGNEPTSDSDGQSIRTVFTNSFNPPSEISSFDTMGFEIRSTNQTKANDAYIGTSTVITLIEQSMDTAAIGETSKETNHNVSTNIWGGDSDHETIPSFTSDNVSHKGDETTEPMISSHDTILMESNNGKSISPSYTWDSTMISDTKVKSNATDALDELSQYTEQHKSTILSAEETHRHTISQQTISSFTSNNVSHVDDETTEAMIVSRISTVSEPTAAGSFSTSRDSMVLETVSSHGTTLMESSSAKSIILTYTSDSTVISDTRVEQSNATDASNKLSKYTEQYKSTILSARETQKETHQHNTSQQTVSSFTSNNVSYVDGENTEAMIVSRISIISEPTDAGCFSTSRDSMASETNSTHGTTLMESSSAKSITLTYTSDSTVISDTKVEQSNATDASYNLLNYTEQYKSTILSAEKSQSNTVSSSTYFGSPMMEAHSSELMTLTTISDSNEPTLNMDRESIGTVLTNSFNQSSELSSFDTTPSEIRSTNEIEASEVGTSTVIILIEQSMETAIFGETSNETNNNGSANLWSEFSDHETISSFTIDHVSHKYDETAESTSFFSVSKELIISETASVHGTTFMESNSGKRITLSDTSVSNMINNTILGHATDALDEPSQYAVQNRSTIMSIEESQSNTVLSNTKVGRPMTEAYSSELMTLTAISDSKKPISNVDEHSVKTVLTNSFILSSEISSFDTTPFEIRSTNQMEASETLVGMSSVITLTEQSMDTANIGDTSIETNYNGSTNLWSEDTNHDTITSFTRDVSHKDYETTEPMIVSPVTKVSKPTATGSLITSRDSMVSETDSIDIVLEETEQYNFTTPVIEKSQGKTSTSNINFEGFITHAHFTQFATLTEKAGDTEPRVTLFDLPIGMVSNNSVSVVDSFFSRVIVPSKFKNFSRIPTRNAPDGTTINIILAKQSTATDVYNEMSRHTEQYGPTTLQRDEADAKTLLWDTSGKDLYTRDETTESLPVPEVTPGNDQIFLSSFHTTRDSTETTLLLSTMPPEFESNKPALHIHTLNSTTRYHKKTTKRSETTTHKNKNKKNKTSSSHKKSKNSNSKTRKKKKHKKSTSSHKKSKHSNSKPRKKKKHNKSTSSHNKSKKYSKSKNGKKKKHKKSKSSNKKKKKPSKSKRGQLENNTDTFTGENEGNDGTDIQTTQIMTLVESSISTATTLSEQSYGSQSTTLSKESTSLPSIATNLFESTNPMITNEISSSTNVTVTTSELTEQYTSVHPLISSQDTPINFKTNTLESTTSILTNDIKMTVALSEEQEKFTSIISSISSKEPLITKTVLSTGLDINVYKTTTPIFTIVISNGTKMTVTSVEEKEINTVLTTILPRSLITESVTLGEYGTDVFQNTTSILIRETPSFSEESRSITSEFPATLSTKPLLTKTFLSTVLEKNVFESTTSILISETPSFSEESRPITSEFPASLSRKPLPTETFLSSVLETNVFESTTSILISGTPSFSEENRPITSEFPATLSRKPLVSETFLSTGLETSVFESTTPIIIIEARNSYEDNRSIISEFPATLSRIPLATETFLSTGLKTNVFESTTLISISETTNLYEENRPITSEFPATLSRKPLLTETFLSTVLEANVFESTTSILISETPSFSEENRPITSEFPATLSRKPLVSETFLSTGLETSVFESTTPIIITEARNSYEDDRPIISEFPATFSRIPLATETFISTGLETNVFESTTLISISDTTNLYEENRPITSDFSSISSRESSLITETSLKIGSETNIFESTQTIPTLPEESEEFTSIEKKNGEIVPSYSSKEPLTTETTYLIDVNTSATDSQTPMSIKEITNSTNVTVTLYEKLEDYTEVSPSIQTNISESLNPTLPSKISISTRVTVTSSEQAEEYTSMFTFSSPRESMITATGPSIDSETNTNKNITSMLTSEILNKIETTIIISEQSGDTSAFPSISFRGLFGTNTGSSIGTVAGVIESIIPIKASETMDRTKKILTYPIQTSVFPSIPSKESLATKSVSAVDDAGASQSTTPILMIKNSDDEINVTLSEKSEEYTSVFPIISFTESLANKTVAPSGIKTNVTKWETQMTTSDRTDTNKSTTLTSSKNSLNTEIHPSVNTTRFL
ncbi:uncharacterized protein LOC113238800 [Hyposmocoma kahamanoa]|uniref:uncharacterized protein LOC113238800 n=1 Tax=Hyposmocoma kahamanoa TaxID=1477025 RepID=UPI000E6D62A8|nr:uncharacterized protein LOC113238800 [Hyposmocoma kahamanoa]